MARHLVLRLGLRVYLGGASESAAKLHSRLSVPGTQHTIAIEEPPNRQAPGQPDLPLN
jgi:hypothetical protein